MLMMCALLLFRFDFLILFLKNVFLYFAEKVNLYVKISVHSNNYGQIRQVKQESKVQDTPKEYNWDTRYAGKTTGIMNE